MLRANRTAFALVTVLLLSTVCHSCRWRVGEARWEFIPMSGLFPESIKVLQELFPGQ